MKYIKPSIIGFTHLKKFFFAYGIVIGILLLFFIFVLSFEPKGLQAITEENPLEILSGVFFILSAILALSRLIALRSSRLWKKFFPIPLIAILSSIDEFNNNQLSVNVPLVGEAEINGFHDLLTITRYFIIKNPPEFIFYVMLPVVVPVLIWLIVFGLSRYLAYKPAHYKNVQVSFLLVNIAISLVCLICVMRIPQDPKNVFFLGFSLARLGMILILGLLVVFALVLLQRMLSNRSWGNQLNKNIERLLKKKNLRQGGLVVLLSGIIGCCIFIASKPFIYTDIYLLSLYVRLLPVVVVFTASQILLMLAILTWNNTHNPGPRANPVETIPLVFLFLFFTLGLFAQIFDMAILNFQYRSFAEELIEFLASITLFFSSILVFQCTSQLDNQ